MVKPRGGNIDGFCSKPSQGNLKRLVKMPREHKCHTKYGSGSSSGYERSRKVTRIKHSFLGMRRMISSHICTENSKIESDQKLCTSSEFRLFWLIDIKIDSDYFVIWINAVQRQRRVGSTPVTKDKMLDYFRIKMCVSEPLWSQNSKSDIFAVRCTECSKSQFGKKWSHQRIRFLGYIFAKITTSTWNLSCQMSRYIHITYWRFFFLKILNSGKSYKNLNFFNFG